MDKQNAQPSKTDPPEYLVPGHYPKHLYKSKQMFVDGEAVKHAITSKLIISRIVQSPEEEARFVKNGWTANLGDYLEESEGIERDEFGDPIPKSEDDEAEEPSEEEAEESSEETESSDEDSPTPRRRIKRRR